jgi:hypothetical protein
MTTSRRRRSPRFGRYFRRFFLPRLTRVRDAFHVRVLMQTETL